MVNENFLYFAQSAVETGEDGTSEAIMVPASKFIGADAVSATSTSFTFKHAYGKAGATHVIKLTHDSGKNKEVINLIFEFFPPSTLMLKKDEYTFKTLACWNN